MCLPLGNLLLLLHTGKRSKMISVMTPLSRTSRLILSRSAKDTTDWEQQDSQSDLRYLYRHLRSANCPVTRKAYQILLNAKTLKRRRDLELRQLTRWASGSEWGFARHPRFRQNLRMPASLDGNRDRAEVASNLGNPFWRDLWGSRSMTSGRPKLSLRLLEAQAKQEAGVLKCCPNELRDLAIFLKPYKAGGEDGVGTNQLRYLPFVAFVYLAKQFERLSELPIC